MADALWPIIAHMYPDRATISYETLSDDETFSVEDGEGFELTGRRTGAQIFSYRATWPMERFTVFPAWHGWWLDPAGADNGRSAFLLPDPMTRQMRRWVRAADSKVGLVIPHPREVYVSLQLRSVPDA